MHPRYLGPLIIISQNKGGAYIIAELNSLLFNRPVAAFHLLPYFAQTKLDLPPLEDLLDISIARLRELEDTTLPDTDNFFENNDPDPDALAEDEEDWEQSIVSQKF